MYLLRKDTKFIPIDKVLSHLYVSNPSLLIFKETKLTWELSIAWSDIPVLLQLKMDSFNKSLTVSSTFFNIESWTNQASNILTKNKNNKYNLNVSK